MSRPDDSPETRVEATHPWVAGGDGRDLTGRVLGDFRVERLLGRGGMGEVYLARQVSLNRPVALKVLRPDLLTRPNYLGRFEAEAAAVAKLNHPNIVHVYLLGSVDGLRFIAMEYVQGTNLKDYLRKKGALDYLLAFSIMRQATLAVGAAGELGLVHRDIKPENLLLTKKGQVKVADFGLCRDLDDAERVSLTQTGTTMGTPLYMSPEQAQGQPLDHRSDLYSLGVTFYHMITGVPPFKADTALALALKHVKERPVSMAVHRPDVPPELDRLVLKLMAKSPADRHQSAAEVLRDLAKAREVTGAARGLPPSVEGTAALPSVSAGVATLAGSGVRAGLVSTPVSTPAAVAASGSASFSSPSLGAVPAAVGRGPLVTTARGVALVFAGLALGVGVGWLARPVDLLAAGAPQPPGPPGLWLAPRWSGVPKLASAEEQYRDALLRSDGETAEADWLAVPGHFPASHDWASRAYTQLARRLLRRRDADRLKALADDLDRWPAGQTHDRGLARIARAGAMAVEGDIDGVLGVFTATGDGRADARFDLRTLTDPALVELCLEVLDLTDRTTARPDELASRSLTRPQLRKIQSALGQALLLNDLRAPQAGRGRPG